MSHRSRASSPEPPPSGGGVSPLLLLAVALVCAAGGLALGLALAGREAPPPAPSAPPESPNEAAKSLARPPVTPRRPAPRSRPAAARPPAPTPPVAPPRQSPAVAAATPPAPEAPAPPPPPGEVARAEEPPARAPQSDEEAVADDAPEDAAAMIWSLDREGIRGAVREATPLIKECYEEWLKMYPDMEGGVRVRFRIAARERTPQEQERDGEEGPVGGVAGAEVDGSDLEHPLMEGCMLASLKGLRFEAPSDGEIEVTYPFRFAKTKEEGDEGSE